MHTSQYGKTTFVYHGDYSGDVIIYTKKEKKIEIPFDAIKAFVAGYILSNKITFLENATDDEILGIN